MGEGFACQNGRSNGTTVAYSAKLAAANPIPKKSDFLEKLGKLATPEMARLGLAGAGASIYNALSGGSNKSAGGGVVKMAKGGIASYRGGDVIDSTENDLYDMPIESLQKDLKEV